MQARNIQPLDAVMLKHIADYEEIWEDIGELKDDSVVVSVEIYQTLIQFSNFSYWNESRRAVNVHHTKTV